MLSQKGGVPFGRFVIDVHEIILTTITTKYVRNLS